MRVEFTDVIEKSYFEGRPYNGLSLTAQALFDNGLAPVTSVDIAGRSIYLSPAFWVNKRRATAWIGYVETSQGYLVRTFFWSRSQAVVRVLIGYRYKDDNGKERVTHHYKGYNEQSLFLPVEVQKLTAARILKPLKFTDEELIFYGTVSDSPEPTVYVQAVEREPVRLDGNFYSEVKHGKIPPEEAVFNVKGQAPDFSRVTDGWKAASDLYGGLRVFSFFSYDRSLRYMFNVDRKERIWLAGVETASELSDCGVRKYWVDVGVLSTPVYEYQSNFDAQTGKYRQDQTGGYGDQEDRRENYVDMYSHYLSRVPLFQELANRIKTIT